MKSSIVILLSSFFAVAFGTAFSQGHGHGHGKGHHHAPQKKTVHKVHKHPGYHRKHMVIVKARPHKHIKVLPPGHRVVNYGRSKYYWHNGLFYRRIGTNYVVCHPSIGLSINFMTGSYHRISFKGKNYYFHQGVLFKKSKTSYVVVKPVIGIRIPLLPMNDVEVVKISGKEYYEFGGHLYKKVGSEYEYVGELED
ncbi:MAG: hypothetical protein EP338_04010 [Bacteroidetes bacterium]|nr:MAG: hypothetical protein EP338_04010 [Bacteroidota bacterium]